MTEQRRLHRRCHVIPLADGLLVRAGDRALVLNDPARASLVQAVLAYLDGADAAVAWSQVPAALRVVDELDGAGLLTDPADDESWNPPDSSEPVSFDLPSARVTVVGDGCAARVAAAVLGDHGVGLGGEGDVVLACPAGPDLAVLGELNLAALAGGVALLPAFPLGDEALVGPVCGPHGTACFRCWELRWLGLSLSITTERAYLDHLRAGGWRREADVPDSVAAWLGRQAAGAAVRWLAGRRNTAALDVAHLRAGRLTHHTVAPHPACDACSAGGFAEPRRAQVEEQWCGWQHGGGAPVEAAVDRLVDPRVGLVADVDGAGPVIPGLLATALTRFAFPHPLGVRRDTPRVANGAGATPAEARLVARVEALERYCGLSLPSPSVTATFEEVAIDAVRPNDLPLYSDRQYAEAGFPHPRFRPDALLRWAWGYGVTRGRPVLVPQDAVRYFGPKGSLLDESSSGVAAHATRAAALLSAVLELVERDAFMIFWLNRLSPPLLHLDRLPPGFARDALGAVRGEGYQPAVGILTTDLGIPVMLAVGWRDDGAGPALRVGAGCDLSVPRALDRAMRELLGAVKAGAERAWEPAEPLAVDAVRCLADHGDAYAHPSWLVRARFLWASPERRHLSAPEPGGDRSAPQRLSDVIELLSAHGHELIAHDLTTPDVAGAVHVVRAVVPGLQPIGFGPQGIRLGGRRLYEAPARMGYTDGPTSEESLNCDPHCFP